MEILILLVFLGVIYVIPFIIVYFTIRNDHLKNGSRITIFEVYATTLPLVNIVFCLMLWRNFIRKKGNNIAYKFFRLKKYDK